MKSIGVAALVAVLLASVAPQVAQAQDEDPEVTRMAKEHFKLGTEAYQAGKYEVAIKELKKAYLLKRLPLLLKNIAGAYRKMNDLDLSMHFYKKYLDEAPADAKDRAETQSIIAELQKLKDSGGEAPPTETAPPPAQVRETPAPRTQAAQWNHTIVDAAPPETPIDVRVSMSVMKGVKVYVYYRAPGESEFTPVLMKRRGAEKVGRIPAEAVSGKSVQYYIEAKDPAGTIVKSSGSASSPNIVMIDPEARPQVLASMEERREESEAETQATPDEEEAPRAQKRPKRDLDEESALTSDEEDRPKPAKRARSGSSTKRGPVFWAGVGLLAGGVAVAGGLGGAGAGISAARSSDVEGLSNGCVDPNQSTCADSDKVFFNNDPAATAQSLSQQADLESQGKLWNDIGVGAAAGGSVLAVAGVVMILVDQFVLHAPPKPKAKKKRRVIRYEEESSAKPWLPTQREVNQASAAPSAPALGGFTF